MNVLVNSKDKKAKSWKSERGWMMTEEEKTETKLKMRKRKKESERERKRERRWLMNNQVKVNCGWEDQEKD